MEKIISDVKNLRQFQKNIDTLKGNDKDDLQAVLDTYKTDPRSAYEMAKRLDTFVREKIPGDIWEDMGGMSLRENPLDDFNAQSTRIDKAIDQINTKWKIMKRNYNLNLKRNPRNWGGLGRGSELWDLREKLEETASWMKALTK